MLNGLAVLTHSPQLVDNEVSAAWPSQTKGAIVESLGLGTAAHQPEPSSRTSQPVQTTSTQLPNLAITFHSVSIPSSVVAGGAPIHGRASRSLINQGNAALPAGQKADVEVWARSTTGDDDVLLGRAVNQNIGNLPVNRTRRITVRINVPGGLPEDQYQIEALVLPQGNLAELNNDNNSLTQGTIANIPPFTDLSVQIGQVPLPRQPAAEASGQARLVIANQGNVAASGPVNIELVLSPTGKFEDGILVGQLTGRKVRIGPGRSASLNVAICLPEGMYGGSYVLMARLMSGDSLPADPDTTNNLACASTIYRVRPLYYSFLQLLGYDVANADRTYRLTYAGTVFGERILQQISTANIHIGAVDNPPGGYRVTGSMDVLSKLWNAPVQRRSGYPFAKLGNGKRHTGPRNQR